jgi:hypothetical protein
MTGKGLTDSEVLETVYKLDESFRNSSNDSVRSSDNEIGDTAVADAVINDNSGDEEETLHQDCMWVTMDNYRGPRELYNCDFGPRNGAENISGIELFFRQRNHSRNCLRN